VPGIQDLGFQILYFVKVFPKLIKNERKKKDKKKKKILLEQTPLSEK
jgi:hypothetical protein